MTRGSGAPRETTRHHLLAHIVDHGGATVAQLCAALGLSDATVRRHLDRLALEGLLATHEVRQPTGRPYRVYQATEDGVAAERDHSAALAARLLAQIKRGRSDERAVARGLAEELVAEHKHEVSAQDPRERIEQTVSVLKTEGILDGWEPTQAGYLLRNHACPYRTAADASDCVCESDRIAIEELLGATVQQVGSVVHGDQACEYLVDEASFGRVAAPARTTTAARPARKRPAQGKKG